MIFLFQTVFSATEAAKLSPAPVAQFVAHKLCKQVQEDEEIQNDIDFSSIEPSRS
jgi:hypothetical protein